MVAAATLSPEPAAAYDSLQFLSSQQESDSQQPESSPLLPKARLCGCPCRAIDQPPTPPLLEASKSPRPEFSHPLQPLLPTARLCVSSCSSLYGCPCKAMGQPTPPPLLEARLQQVFLPSSDEQGSDLSQPAGRQSLQASTPPPPPSALMKDDEDMDDLDLLLTGPKNEKHLDECLGGVFDCYSPQMEDQLDLLNLNDDEAAVNEFEINDYIDPSILGCFLPSGSLGHGRRGPRRRSSSERLGLFGHNFGSHEPSTSGGRKQRRRKNNIHWTNDEVRQLLTGVYFHGVGNWSYIKRKYFKASIRTSDHLKDKWKNLVKACRKENGRMLLHLEPSVIERIKEIDANDPYPKPSN